jgi:hypothetical protein
MSAVRPDCLVADTLLREQDTAIRAATASAAVGVAGLLDEAGWTAFRYYLLFSDPAAVRAAGFDDIPTISLFYNRYYWFKRFVNQRAAVQGHDVGLEQQAFKLLEAAPEGVDWSVVEALDVQAAG